MATITTLPTPPSKTDLTNFDSRADAFLTALPNFGDEANDVRDEVVALKNTTSGYADAAALSATAASSSESVAIASANYEGAWTAKSYTVPASVSHLGALWVLEEAAADTDIPGTSTKWTFWSLTEYPIEVNPTLDLDFENQVYKSYVDHSGLTEWSLNGVDSKLTFVRATTKTYFDAKGILQTAAANEIAIDYDPATGACEGFQPEAAATNLLLASEAFNVDIFLAVSSVTGTFEDGETVGDGTRTGVYRAGTSSATSYAISGASAITGWTGTLTGVTSGATATIGTITVAWTKIRSSIGGDAVVVPDGSSVVCKLIEDTTADNTHLMEQIGLTVVVDTVYTTSWFMKAGERSHGRLAYLDGTGGVYVDFDLTAGTIGSANLFSGGTASGATISDCGDGWYRISLSGKIASGTTAKARIEMHQSAGVREYTGDGTSGLYVWGAQVEAV